MTKKPWWKYFLAGLGSLVILDPKEQMNWWRTNRWTGTER